MQKNWYAVYTKLKCEKKVSASLTKKKIENYCPLNRKIHDESMKKKKYVVEPLFASYVFVRITENEMMFLKQQTSDIINFVYWLGRPVIIKDVEIENIQEFLNTYTNIYLEKTEVNLNKMVRIINRTPIIETSDNVIVMNSTIVKMTLPTLGCIICASANSAEFELEETYYGLRSIV